MLFETNREKGRAGMSLAIAYFGSNGYTVSIPLNDTQWYDLIVEKDNNFYTVQCKATGSKDNVIQFRSSGGTNGSTYDNILRVVKDPDVCDPIRYLREREIVHYQRFGEALRNLQERLDSKNFYAFNPEFDRVK